MFGVFKEEVLIENLIRLCVGDISLLDAEKHLESNCGLTKKDFSLLSKTILSNYYTDVLMEAFTVESCKQPKLLEMYLRSGCSEWMDAFCYGGTVVSLMECAQRFKEIDDCLVSAYNKVKESEERVNTLELRNKIFYEKAGLPEMNILVDVPVKRSVSRSFIYFIQAADLCKIGYTKDVDARLAQLQTGCPTRLQLIHTYEVKNTSAKVLEKAVHEHFRYRRVVGEWFNIDINIAEFEDVCCKFDK